MTDILERARKVAERLHATWKGTPGCEVPRNPRQARDGYEALTAMIEEVKAKNKDIETMSQLSVMARDERNDFERRMLGAMENLRLRIVEHGKDTAEVKRLRKQLQEGRAG